MKNTYSEIIGYLKCRVNLPMADIRRITSEAVANGWTREKALSEARALYK